MVSLPYDEITGTVRSLARYGTPAWTAIVKNNFHNLAVGFPFTTVGQTPGNTYPETWYIVDDETP